MTNKIHIVQIKNTTIPSNVSSLELFEKKFQTPLRYFSKNNYKFFIF